MGLDKIKTKEEYDFVLREIEVYIQKATDLGGFAKLQRKEAKELANLSSIAEEFENTIPLMPINIS